MAQFFSVSLSSVVMLMIFFIRQYSLETMTLGPPLNFKLCDTKGLEIDDGIDTAEFCYILDGNMPDKYLVQKHNIYFPNECLNNLF